MKRPGEPDFWDVGPHDPIPVEKAWREFIRTLGGKLVEDLVPPPRNFHNADFLFRGVEVVAELKEIQSEFSDHASFQNAFDSLMKRVLDEDPSWKPSLFGGTTGLPSWFDRELVRLFRDPISRILKRANRQLRETKSHFGIASPTGLLLLVNDGFTSLWPDHIRWLVADLLVQSYSSIDCVVYLTVNTYVEYAKNETPGLMWAPLYSDRAPESLVGFVDDLGRRWFDYMEQAIGPSSVREEIPLETYVVGSFRPIVVRDRNS